MGHEAKQPRAAKAALAFLAASLLCLALASQAIADPPAHARAKALDVEGLNKACGVAVDSKGDLYAASAGTDEVKVYDPAHAELTSIENADEPCGLAVDSKGRLYVSEQATGNVVRYVPNKYPFEGTPTYGAAEAIDSSGEARGIATDRTDDRLYVAEGTHVAIYKSNASFEKNVGEGELTEATGVAAYTYIYTGNVPTNLKRHSYLFVADAAGDQVKTFAAKEGSALQLRRTISGVDHDEDPETAEEEFGFGAQGAHLAADPGNESRETRACAQVQVEGQDQACTQGHFFLYDEANNAVDEFDATGEFVDQIANPAFADAGPTALALERSGTAGDGTLYVGAGASSGARLLAFRPLGMPARDPLPALSRALTKARGVAVDCQGYVYVAAEAKVRVYDPAGNEVTSFEDAEAPRDLAADCAGNVYTVEVPSSSEANLTYYAPSEYPPKAATPYTRTEPPLVSGEEGEGLEAVAVNPADEHVFAVGDSDFAPIVVEYGSAAEGSALEGECGAGLGLPLQRLDIDVYAATGEVYLTANPTFLTTVRCGGEPELLVKQIKGGGCPSGEFGANPAIALDQSNGHIVQFEPGQPGDSAREYDSSGACVAEFGSFSSNASGYRVAVDSSCAIHEPPLSEQTTPTCASLYPADGNVYVASDGLNNEVQPYDVSAFGPLEYPEVEEEEEPKPKFPLTVIKGGSGTGTVESSPAGIDCGATCSAEYDEGTAVTLAASPAAGSEFSGWGLGECESEPELGQKCVLMTSAAKTVHASFDQILHTLTVEAEGPGEVSGPGPIACGSECEAQFPEGETIALSASADEGAHFLEWSGPGAGPCTGSSTPSCEVQISEDKTVKAIFAPDPPKGPPLTVKIEEGEGTVVSNPAGLTCSGLAPHECSSEAIAAGTLTLTASPATGYLFKSWKGCDNTGGGFGVVGRQCTIDLNGPKTVGAKFITAHSLTATKAAPTAGGTVSTSPAGINCATTCTAGQALYKAGPLTLKAKAAKHFHFVEFKGGSGSAAVCDGVKTETCPITLGEDSSIEAQFAEDAKHTLSYAATGGGQGSLKTKPTGIACGFTCSAAAAEFFATELGGKVEVEVKLNKGTSSVEWTKGAGTCTGKAEAPVLSCEVTMSEDRELIAKFE